MSYCDSFNRMIFDIASIIANEPEQSMNETKASTDFDVMVELAKLTKQQVVQHEEEQDLCLICGESQCVVKDYQEWIQCESCSKWVHQYCDGILNAALTEQLHYECPVCRIIKLQKHPCNVNEQLGRDPRFQDVDKSSKKQRRKKPNALSDSETNETTTHISRNTGHREGDRNTRHGGQNNHLIHQNVPEEPAAPPLNQEEINQLHLLGKLVDYGPFDTVIEEKAPVERKKSLATESSAQNIINYVNGAFNQLRHQTSRTFHSLQAQARHDSIAIQPSVDYHHTDVSFAHILALFQQNKLEIDEQQQLLIDGNHNLSIVSQSVGQALGVKKNVQEAENEKRHQEIIHQQIVNYELEPFKPRVNGSIFSPILRIDADLRVIVGMNIFDGFLQAVERNRLEYVKTLIPAAAQACWIYQQQSSGQKSGQNQFLGMHNLQFQHENLVKDEQPYQIGQEYGNWNQNNNLIDDQEDGHMLDLTDSVVRRRMSIQNFVRLTKKVLESAEPQISKLRLGHGGYLPVQILLSSSTDTFAKDYKHSIFEKHDQGTNQDIAKDVPVTQQSSSVTKLPILPTIPSSAPFIGVDGHQSLTGNSSIQANVGTGLQYNSQQHEISSGINLDKFKPPRLLNTRQWFDLRSRGVQEYPGLGLVRMTILQAMVNISLGMNVFDRVLGDPLTEHIIRFGVNSSRQSLEKQLRTSGHNSAIEPGCLFEVANQIVGHLQQHDHQQSFQTVENGLSDQNDPTTALVLPDDENIQDWDILETPTSVVWALQIIGQVVALFNAEINSGVPTSLSIGGSEMEIRNHDLATTNETPGHLDGGDEADSK